MRYAVRLSVGQAILGELDQCWGIGTIQEYNSYPTSVCVMWKEWWSGVATGKVVYTR